MLVSLVRFQSSAPLSTLRCRPRELSKAPVVRAALLPVHDHDDVLITGAVALETCRLGLLGIESSSQDHRPPLDPSGNVAVEARERELVGLQHRPQNLG